MKIFDWERIRKNIVTIPKEILWFVFWIGLFYNPFLLFRSYYFIFTKKTNEKENLSECEAWVLEREMV